jgi:hypothetical protein
MENNKSENINNQVIDLLNRNFELADIKDYLLQKGYPEGEIAAALEQQQTARERLFPSKSTKYSYSRTARYFFTGVSAIIIAVLLLRHYSALPIVILAVIGLLGGIYRLVCLFFDYPTDYR